MKEQRAQLPAYQARESLLSMFREHQVTIIKGATGCGKSTQVPQLLLEEAQARSQKSSILVAQPRRLAATALAERVSSELGEASVGGLCGYRIRGESKVSAGTIVTFVTTGILLRMMEEDPHLSFATHVVVDEVHERSVDVDLLLFILRRAVRANPDAIRVVLMSATIDTDAFAAYFGAAPAGGLAAGTPNASVGVCEIAGRSFPVVEHFLEAAVAHTGYRLDRRSEWARDSPLPETASLGAGGKAAAEASNAQAAAQAARAKADAEGTAATALVAHNLEERAEKLANAAAASAASRSIGGVATEQMRAEGVAGTAARCGGADVASTLRTMDLSCVNEELVEALVLRHHRAAAGGGGGGDCGGHGAILVFMPGVAEIERLCDRLEALRGTPLHIVRLHSQLSTAEQRIAFLPPPTPGQTKVVVATDIAETSVTIPDVVLVIDGGLHRMLACDDRASHAPHLKMARISLAAAKQRAGRAGRVRAGVCYHLYSEVEARAGAGMNETLPAEIRRVPLDGTILQLRGLVRTYPALRHASATTLLAEFLEPPEAAAVDRATRALAGLGALRIDTDGGEVLTSLGARLCRLGVEPRLGRTLLCADVLGCLCAASVVVAGMEAPTDPFGRGARAGEARRRLDSTSCHLALLRAHGEWKRAASFGGGHERRATCEGLGVSDAAMRQVDQRARRIEELVHQSRGRGDGVEGGVEAGGQGDTADGPGGSGTGRDGGRRVGDAALVKACLLCGGSASLMGATLSEGGRQHRTAELRWRVGKADVALRAHDGTVLAAQVAAAANTSRSGEAGGKRSSKVDGKGGERGEGKGAGGGKGGGGGEGGANSFAGAPMAWYVCLRLLRSGRGLAALDTTLVSPQAILLVGTPADAIDAVGEPPASSSAMVRIGLGGECVDMKRSEADAIAVLRARLELGISAEKSELEVIDVTEGTGIGTGTGGGGGGGGRGSCSSGLVGLRQAVLELLLPSMDVPWDGLPEGWLFAPDEAGRPLYRSSLDMNVAVRAKPTISATEYAEQQQRDAKARSELAAARKEQERTRQRVEPRTGDEGQGTKADHADEAAARRVCEVQAATREETKNAAKSAADAARVAARLAKEKADAEEMKKATKALAAAAEAKEAEARAASGVSGSLRGVTRLLAELELEKYADAFASAGVDDAKLIEIAEVIDLDVDEGLNPSEGEGAAAVEALITAVGVKGGSAVKLRRRLLDPQGGKKSGGGGRGAGRDSEKGGKGKGGGGGGGSSKGGRGRGDSKGAGTDGGKEDRNRATSKGGVGRGGADKKTPR